MPKPRVKCAELLSARINCAYRLGKTHDPEVVVCGGLATAAYARISNGSSHLLSVDGFWTDLSLAESIRQPGFGRDKGSPI